MTEARSGDDRGEGRGLPSALMPLVKPVASGAGAAKDMASSSMMSAGGGRSEERKKEVENSRYIVEGGVRQLASSVGSAQ